jgi:hypothetical protein
LAEGEINYPQIVFMERAARVALFLLCIVKILGPNAQRFKANN